MKRLPDTDLLGDTPVTGADRSRARISFVGAGPGAADLLTVRAIRLLAQADVVLHDALGCEEALQFCPQASRVAVGKRAGGKSVEQSFINQQLVALASQGLHVVRLKGGDPTIFGRLDEEISAAVNAGIAYDITPGITAASAAAATAGATLTQRGSARAVTLVTPAVGKDEQANPEWAQAASSGATVAVYMAGRQLRRTASQLLAAGFAADTPALVAAGVSTADQSFEFSTLRQIADGAPTRFKPGTPCVFLAGEAVRPRKQASRSADHKQGASDQTDAAKLARAQAAQPVLTPA
ncbi:MAG: uroporphyrinogen-III C-methyltransferase [Burkholderiaceae bacterium]